MLVHKVQKMNIDIYQTVQTMHDGNCFYIQPSRGLYPFEVNNPLITVDSDGVEYKNIKTNSENTWLFCRFHHTGKYGVCCRGTSYDALGGFVKFEMSEKGSVFKRVPNSTRSKMCGTHHDVKFRHCPSEARNEEIVVLGGTHRLHSRMKGMQFVPTNFAEKLEEYANETTSQSVMMVNAKTQDIKVLHLDEEVHAVEISKDKLTVMVLHKESVKIIDLE